MMADLVDQDVADNALQVLAGLAPVIEDRAPVKEYHVHVGGCYYGSFKKVWG